MLQQIIYSAVCQARGLLSIDLGSIALNLDKRSQSLIVLGAAAVLYLRLSVRAVLEAMDSTALIVSDSRGRKVTGTYKAYMALSASC